MLAIARIAARRWTVKTRMRYKYNRKIVLPHSTVSYIKMLLHMKDGMGEDDTISHTAVFDNGIEMDIKLCGADDDYPWTEAVLFENGCELCHTDVEDEYFGVWEIEYNGDTYIVEIGEE